MHNWILQSIEPKVRAQFDGRLRAVDLRRGEILQQQGEPIDRVYFPQGALIGLVNAMPAGDAVQTATVGWDGALGVFEACGSRLSAFLAEVQVSGSAWCMPADDYRRLFEASPALRIQVHKYVEILLTESRQYVACNALHTVEGRLCRSLLEALERSGDSDALPTTQDALAQALGVQRTTVTAAIAQLQSAGALKSGRAVIQVLDRSLLEQGACCCRETLQLARKDIYRSTEEVCET
jgi:CRP-like cAMP-binding protein